MSASPDSSAPSANASRHTRDPRIDIAQVVYGFAYGIDTRDWNVYRSTFVEPDDIVFDYESYSGRPAARMSAEQWIATVRPLFEGLDATQHTMSNPIVDIAADGRSARCRMYMQATHFLWRDDLDAAEFTIGGYYDDRLVLRATAGDGGGQWKIDAVKLTVWWRRGNDRIMQLARQAP